MFLWTHRRQFDNPTENFLLSVQKMIFFFQFFPQNVPLVTQNAILTTPDFLKKDR